MKFWTNHYNNKMCHNLCKKTEHFIPHLFSFFLKSAASRFAQQADSADRSADNS